MQEGKWEGELQYRNIKTGEIIDTYATTFIVTDPATGEPLYLANTSRDITEQKQAESAVNRLSKAVEQAGDGIIVTDTDGYVLFSNEAWAKMHNYTPQEIEGQHLSLFHTEEQITEEVLPFNEVVLETGANAGEINHARKDGTIFPTIMTTTVLKDDLGNPSGLVSTARDITEQKESQKRIEGLNELRESLIAAGALEEKLKRITDGVVEIFDADFARIWITKPGDRCDEGCIHAKVTEGPHVCRYRDRCLHLMTSSGRYTHIDGEVHQRVPFGCYKIGLVASAEESKFITNDAGNDPRVHNNGWARELGLVSFAGYQLVSPEGEPVGVLALFSQHPISSVEDALLETLANSTSQVIQAERTRIERERFTNQLRTAADLAEQVTAILDPDVLLPEVVDELQKRFGYYHAHIYTLSEPSSEQLADADAITIAHMMRERPLVLRAGSGKIGQKLLQEGHLIPLNMEKSLVARAARARAPIVVSDTGQEPDFMPNPMLPETRTEVAIPLVAGDNVLGVLDVQDNQPGRFAQTDLNVLSTIAGQVAIALQNASYFEEVQRTADRLREVDRLKSEFLASMSHELRTPLNSIIGYTEIMLMGLDSDLDAETLEDVQAIYDNGQHLLRIINDVLDLAKIEAGRLELSKEEVPIEALIDAASSSVTGLLIHKEKPVEFKVEIEENLPMIIGDQVRLNQIINNLTSNAVKFTEEGHITLRAFVDHSDTENGKWICLQVEDSGVGIDHRDLDKLFERFQQVDGSNSRKQEGTGLGLAITRHLIHMHGGTITVDSTPGKGSTFTVRLPVKEDEAQPAEKAKPSKSRKKKKKKA
jgi:PAS domain S-box-containing protein